MLSKEDARWGSISQAAERLVIERGLRDARMASRSICHDPAELAWFASRAKAQESYLRGIAPAVRRALGAVTA